MIEKKANQSIITRVSDAGATISLAAFCAILLLIAPAAHAQEGNAMNEGFYGFTMNDIDGNAVPLEQYRGKVLLVVNVASECGYTHQYETLEKLYRAYKDRGLEVLGFPANDFGEQEPGTNEDIKKFCSTEFDVSFDMFSKIHLKGDSTDPLYKYLTEQSEMPGEVKWNFYKFLIDRQGHVVARWNSKADPMSDGVTAKVEECLAQ